MNLLVAPLEALTDKLLTDTERRVLLALFSFRSKSSNVVWPSTASIAERANIGDIPRVSKITSSLAEKGWLTKKKKGFTGCNEYRLTFPERLNTNLAEFTNLEELPNLDQNTNTNLAEFTNSNLANFTKCNEQSIEQSNEQTITIENSDPVKTKKPKPEFPEWFEKILLEFPQRAGSNDKRRAWSAASARLKEGCTPDEMLEAVRRYRSFVTANGNLNTQFVFQWATFFGPGGHIKNPWTIPLFAVQPRASPKQSSATLGFTSEDYQRGIGPDGSF